MNLAIIGGTSMYHTLAAALMAAEQRRREMPVLIVIEDEPAMPTVNDLIVALKNMNCLTACYNSYFGNDGQIMGQILPPDGVYPIPAAARTPATRFKKKPRKPG